jgi:hypothetical protein
MKVAEEEALLNGTRGRQLRWAFRLLIAGLIATGGEGIVFLVVKLGGI